ncbi:glycosyltransferase [Adlercreutzia sp. ZJ473]|uniref:glycosyltransferase n=1 Tax=Adlercreutzia sp. ZJ473 TaxID=2722822 RepID=UPI001555E70C|nr:glycosyltransferase [Adlercreutzia sp. ZJ473]
MADQPLVSVIVPIYNAEPFLEQCLESIEAQTCRSLEIICLNDGSTDQSLAIMRRHAAADDRIIVIDKQNQGYGATCNRGLDVARGAWIAIVEPDDWIEPDMYRAMLTFANRLKKPIDIVKTPYWRIINPDTKQQRKINCSYRRRVKPGEQPFAVNMAPHLLRHHPSIWSAIYRASFLEDRHIRFHEIPGAGWADNPFLIDTLCQTDRIAYLDEPFYCYREETEEKSRASALNNTMMPFDRWDDMMDVLERLGIEDATILQEQYQRAFTYYGGTIEHTGERADVLARMEAVMGRMTRPELVLGNPNLSPAQKELFADSLGIEAPARSNAVWARKLVGEAAYTLRNAGLAYTLNMIRKI